MSVPILHVGEFTIPNVRASLGLEWVDVERTLENLNVGIFTSNSGVPCSVFSEDISCGFKGDIKCLPCSGCNVNRAGKVRKLD